MRVLQTLFVLIQAASLVQSVTWTLHKSCYENEALKNAVIAAVADAVKLAKLATEKLKEARTHLAPIPGGPQPPEAARRIREVADFFTAPLFQNKVEDIITRFEQVAKLGGPVGANENFADGPTWRAQSSSNQNYLNFVIACAPQIEETTDRFFNTYWFDHLRQIPLPIDCPLIPMHQDIVSGNFLKPKDIVRGCTYRDINPEGDRGKIPDAMVLHKLWLERLLAKEGTVLADQRLLDYVTRQDAPQILRQKGRTGMDSILWRAEGSILHEFFHLSAFGGLLDVPAGRDAYGWTKNVQAKNTDNPDLYALLALAIKLTVDGYKVDQEGMITRY